MRVTTCMCVVLALLVYGHDSTLAVISSAAVGTAVATGTAPAGTAGPAPATGNASAPCGHPKCTWTCDQPTCDAVCHPICSKPKCSQQCEKVGCAVCKVHCPIPQCRIECNKLQCEKEHCANCTSVCMPAKCSTHCVPPEPKCVPVCEAADCQWKCAKPTSCPKPKCELHCEQPTCPLPAVKAASPCATTGSCPQHPAALLQVGESMVPYNLMGSQDYVTGNRPPSWLHGPKPLHERPRGSTLGYPDPIMRQDHDKAVSPVPRRFRFEEAQQASAPFEYDEKVPAAEHRMPEPHMPELPPVPDMPSQAEEWDLDLLMSHQ